MARLVVRVAGAFAGGGIVPLATPQGCPPFQLRRGPNAAIRQGTRMSRNRCWQDVMQRETAMSREKLVRDTAYAIWEAEGRPHGRDADHWRMAEERVARSEEEQGKANSAGASKGRKKQEPPAKSAAAKPAAGPAKASAGKSRTKKPV